MIETIMVPFLAVPAFGLMRYSGLFEARLKNVQDRLSQSSGARRWIPTARCFQRGADHFFNTLPIRLMPSSMFSGDAFEKFIRMVFLPAPSGKNS
jgi:hypothetical protein